MSSIKYNIKRKIEWMGRRLRYIDGPEEIKEWAAAIRALNVVFKEVDIKGSSDNWKPWKRSKVEAREDSMTMGSQSWEGTVASKKGMGTEMIEKRKKPFLAKLRPPRVQVDGDDEEMLHRKAAVMEMLNTPQKEKWSESVWSESVDSTIENLREATNKEASKKTKAEVNSCTLQGGYLFVYNVQKDWDAENKEYRKTRIPIVGRKYVVWSRSGDKSKWTEWRKGYTDNKGRVNHIKGSENWKWYRVNVENDGCDEYVRVILNGKTLVSPRALEMVEKAVSGK